MDNSLETTAHPNELCGTGTAKYARPPGGSALWAKHIHCVLRNIGLTPTCHEPCLYHGNYDRQEVFLVRQVDDFCVSAKDETTTTAILRMIDDQLKEPLKYQGTIDYFNGVTLC